MNLNCARVIEGGIIKCRQYTDPTTGDAKGCGKLMLLIEDREPTTSLPPTYRRVYWCRCGNIIDAQPRIEPAPHMPLPILQQWAAANGESV